MTYNSNLFIHEERHGTHKDSDRRIDPEPTRFAQEQIHRHCRDPLRDHQGTLASGEDVYDQSSRQVLCKGKAERKGRNPASVMTLMLRTRKVVTFRCSGR